MLEDRIEDELLAQRSQQPVAAVPTSLTRTSPQRPTSPAHHIPLQPLVAHSRSARRRAEVHGHGCVVRSPARPRVVERSRLTMPALHHRSSRHRLLKAQQHTPAPDRDPLVPTTRASAPPTLVRAFHVHQRVARDAQGVNPPRLNARRRTRVSTCRHGRGAGRALPARHSPYQRSALSTNLSMVGRFPSRTVRHRPLNRSAIRRLRATTWTPDTPLTGIWNSGSILARLEEGLTKSARSC